MNRRTASIIGALTLGAVALVGTAGAGVHITGLVAQIDDARAQTITVSTEADALLDNSTAKATVNTDLRDLITDREAILAERAALLTAIGKARAALEGAPSDVDVVTQRKQVISAQERAVTAVTVDVMKDATRAVTAATTTVTEKVNQWRAQEDAVRAEIGSAGIGGGLTAGTGLTVGAAKSGWFAELRSILNKAGGSRVTLKQYDGNCSGVRAAACSFSSGYIGVTSALAGYSYSYKVWVMTHELAHQYQFKVMHQIKGAGTYRSLFGSNIELLANCMAYAKGAPRYGHACSSAQVNWSSSIWRGVVSR